MRFVAAMAWREVRSSWRRLALFFLCIALGVGAMVSLRSFSRVFMASLARDSQALLAGDVRIESAEPLTGEMAEIVRRQAASSEITGRTQMIETQTIARVEGAPETRPVMVELRAVDAAYPLRGTVRMAAGANYAHGLLAGDGILVTPSLLDRLNVSVGGRLRIGTTAFVIRGIVERLPGNALDFGPMPRVLVEHDAAAAAGLLGFGSRARYVSLLTVADGAERRVAQALSRELGSRQFHGSVATFHYVENWLAGSLSNIDGFLSLIGLAMVVLGGIGVASVTRVFVQQRLPTIAILKCLGGRTRRVLSAYVAQVLALGLGGSLAGLVVAQAITSGLAGYASRRLPLDVEPRLSAIASAQGVAVGVLIALLFALPPLLEIRDVKPILVLRRDLPRRRVDLLRLVTQGLILAAVAVLSGWMAGTYRNAGLFVGGLAATLVVLQATGTLLMTLVARLRQLRSFVLRHGINSLYRPGNQTRVTLFTVGLGALFVLAVRLFQVNLQQEYALDLGGLRADIFLIDVLPAQTTGVRDALIHLGASEVTLLPLARGRLVGISRAPANASRVPRGRVGGEWRLTERAELDPGERVVAGRFWPSMASADPEVSVEGGLAEWLMLQVGDRLQFEIAGRRVDALVSSVRVLDRRARTLSQLVRSDILFRPGGLEGLPHTFVGAARGPTDLQARARLQNAFLAAFPGATLVDALDEITEVRRRIADFSSAVSILGGLVLACGVLILIGSVAMTKMHRVYEGAILKTLGAKRRLLVRIALVEYGVLGLLAGLVGSAASIAVTWAMSRWGTQPLPWHFHPLVNAAGVALTAVLVVAVGIAVMWDVVARKPLGILRER